MSCSSHVMAPKQPRQQHPRRLFIRQLPHDITDVKLKAVLLERSGCSDVQDMVDIFVLRGFPRLGDRPYVPSTAIVCVRSVQDGGDNNASKRVIQALIDVFDGRVVFDKDDDGPGAMASLVEWSPVYFDVFPPSRHGAAGKKRKKLVEMEWRPGTIEDDENYRRFCARLDTPVCEMPSEANEKQTQFDDGEPKVETAPRGLLVQELLAECGHLNKVKATRRRRKRKEEVSEKVPRRTKTKKARKGMSQHEKKKLLRNTPCESAREVNVTMAPKGRSKAETKKKLCVPRILRPEGRGDAPVEIGGMHEGVGVDAEPREVRRQKRRQETKKGRVRGRRLSENEEHDAVERTTDRGKRKARRSRKKKDLHKADGEKGETPNAETSKRWETEGKELGQGHATEVQQEREESKPQKTRGKRQRERHNKNCARGKESKKKGAASPTSVDVTAEDKGKGSARPRGPHVDPCGERGLDPHLNPTTVAAEGYPCDAPLGEGRKEGGKAFRRGRHKKKPSDRGTKEPSQVLGLFKKSGETIVVSSSDQK
ncbi:hypothetical protein TraAM80_08203 [Trypanosoma rangeli]|uniref:Uncharacterized protein n=1 Tax=Trypanosoma rangeli TaxID=5698 RepID=A0A3R7NA53_TRYRA|nr:uncharacterized protein TraAM80_08203 [Trypanosoma rangeli]RNE99406.1 hypothetical protein TraAM80_08203 [Trypanosoma rangeli]|eukprot:RNE99406.1 hypothetical protein TraAM80_08203 [Trypanosoma rangeli]